MHQLMILATCPDPADMQQSKSLLVSLQLRPKAQRMAQQPYLPIPHGGSQEQRMAWHKSHAGRPQTSV